MSRLKEEEEEEKAEVSSLDEYDTDSTESDENSNEYCKLITEKGTGRYTLHIAATFEANCNIIIGTEVDRCEVYHLGENQLAKLTTFQNLDSNVTGVQCSPEDSNLFYCGTRNSILLYDLRTPKKSVLRFIETTQPKQKKMVCFEVSPNNRLLAAGTELFEGEVFMMFWDVRNVRLMGAYWESHADTITQVKFDSNDANRLMSGSVDGLINIYDLNHTSEDNALKDVFNTESSVEQLLWFTKKGKDCISCITHTADIQLWLNDGAEPYAHFHRLDITKIMKKKSEAHCYIVSTHKQLGDELLILAGSYDKKNKDYVKCLYSKAKELIPFCNLVGNKQRVRCSFYNPHHNLLLTGGEQGLLNVWNVNLTHNF